MDGGGCSLLQSFGSGGRFFRSMCRVPIASRTTSPVMPPAGPCENRGNQRSGRRYCASFQCISTRRLDQRCSEYCFNKLHNPCIPVCKVSCQGCDPSVAAGGPTRLPGLGAVFALSHQYCRSLTVAFGSVKFVMYTSQTLALTTAGPPPSLLQIRGGPRHQVAYPFFPRPGLVAGGLACDDAWSAIQGTGCARTQTNCLAAWSLRARVKTRFFRSR